ncbi:MAG: hypothetical protein ACI8UC_001689 [Psychromonas sp.]|jgi:hypothetical protein
MLTVSITVNTADSDVLDRDRATSIATSIKVSAYATDAAKGTDNKYLDC